MQSLHSLRDILTDFFITIHSSRPREALLGWIHESAAGEFYVHQTTSIAPQCNISLHYAILCGIVT